MSGAGDSTGAILATLADGHFHSGESLARVLGISRSAVWKHVQQLAEFELDVFRVPGKGYRLATPLELLDPARIRSALTSGTAQRLTALEVLRTVDSTNNWLGGRPERTPAVCLAEVQRAGRGRRGREWISPFGANLYMSLAWEFDELPPGFTALGMVAAIAVVRALQALEVSAAAVKWPNDLIANGRKLGGILVDLHGEAPTRMRAVIGVGVNVRMPASASNRIDQEWTDLMALSGGVPPGRNRLAAEIVNQLCEALEVFGEQGFAAFREDWRTLDAIAGRDVVLEQHDRRIQGTALGVDQDGALLLSSAGGTKRFVSGDISLRVQT